MTLRPSTLRTTAVLLLAAAMVASVTCPAAAATATGTLGTAVSIAANTETTITYLGGLQLVVTTSTASDVTLSAYASLATSLPDGYTALTFSAGAGFTFAYTGGGTLIKAQLTTQPVVSTAALTGSATAGCLRYDVDARAYSKIDNVVYTPATKVAVVDLPAADTYVFAAVSATAAVPTFYSETRATSSTTATFTFPDGFTLEASTSNSNTVTVARSSVSTHSDPANMTNLGAYFTIDKGTASGPVSALLRFTYDASISASAAASIKIGFWNASANSGAGAWSFLSTGGSVDTNVRVVSQTTTHFSEWGVFGGGDDDDLEWTNQPLNPASPSKCYSVDYDHNGLGVLNFKMTKVDGGGNLRMYLSDSSCPSSSSYQMRSQLVTSDGDSDTLCVNSGTTPSIGDKRYYVAVFAEGLSGAGSQTRFSLEVSKGVFCNACAGRTAMSALAALLVLAVAYVLQ